MKAIPFVRCRADWKPLRAAALSLMVTAAALSGCGIYRHEVLQGNFISREQAQALQVGQTRAQVRQILGTPLLVDMFRAERWDYVFTMQNRPGVAPQKYAVSAFFSGDALTRVEGADGLPTEQEFVDLIGSRKTYKPRNLQAAPEQLARFAETNKPPVLQEQPTAPASTSYPPLPQ